MPAAPSTPHQQRAETPATYARRRLLVAGALSIVPGAIWLRKSGDSPIGAAGTQAPTSTRQPTLPAPSTTSVTAAEPAGAESLGALTGDLVFGMVDDEVASLQQRLHDLHFDPGPVDGWFGDATLRSVWAFEKLVLGVPREQATGVVTPSLWDQMRLPVSITPRRSTNAQANHTEIYLPEQVIAIFHRDQPVVISHMASGELDENGEPAEWCEVVTVDTDNQGRPLDEPVDKDICGRSKTPAGVFEFYRRVEGIRNGALGSMWNPVYFNYGIAVHGATNVPLAPASHGCVRIPMHIADYFQDLITNGDRALVWNGSQQPEDVSDRDMLPVFDYPNPDAPATTTTTTSTTTTTTTTTTTPATTAAPATTKPTTSVATVRPATTLPPPTTAPTTAPASATTLVGS